MTALRVQLGERSYDIAVTSDALASVGAFARERAAGARALVVTDTHVQPHAQVVRQSLEAAGFRTGLAALPAGEGQKSLDVARGLYDQLVDLPADRKTLVVAVGGGVMGDL